MTPIEAHRRALAGDSWPDLLREFSVRFGHHVGTVPGVPPWHVEQLRARLVGEECGELLEAMDYGDVEEIARECVDLLYVILGTMLAYGFNPDPLFRAVHAANMAKDLRKDESGKTLKPPDWRPADIAGLLRLQGWDGRPYMRPAPSPAAPVPASPGPSPDAPGAGDRP